MLKAYSPVVRFNKRSTATAGMVEHPGGAYLSKFEVATYFNATLQKDEDIVRAVFNLLSEIEK